MKEILDKWWDNGNKNIGIRHYKKSWKEYGNKPMLLFRTNGAKKGKDNCLDVILIIGYTIFNYTDFGYNK